MNLLYFDIFFLLAAWFAGITTDIAGFSIHLLPLLACVAVLLRWFEPPKFVKNAVNRSILLRTKK